MSNLLEVARRYRDDAYFSVTPVLADGTKKPAGQWKTYQDRMPTDAELGKWFGPGRLGIALVHGAISGGSEVIDFDGPGAFEEWTDLCESHELTPLVKRCAIVETPTGGRHVYYRHEGDRDGNLKLARYTTPFDTLQAEGMTEEERKRQGVRYDDRTGEWFRVETKIETRGEGGYTLAPGSPVACHPARKPYKKLSGDLLALPVLTAEERYALLSMARACNDWTDPEEFKRVSQTVPKTQTQQTAPPAAKPGLAGPTGSGLKPGEDYDLRITEADILQMLSRAGWEEAGRRGEIVDLTRPGKNVREGISATLNAVGQNVFYCFTTAAPPFDNDRAYTPFALYAHLECHGDFAEAARRLAAQGYGDPRKQKQWAGPVPPEAASGDAPPSPEEWEPIIPLGEYRLPPFPVRTFPPALAAFIEAQAEATQTPPDLAATLVLASLATTLQKKVEVCVRRGWTEPVNLYLACVLAPGNRKTSVQRAVTRPLELFERQETERLRPEIADKQAKLRVLQSRLREVENRAARQLDSGDDRDRWEGEVSALSREVAQTPEPADFRICTEDCTPEKLAGLLAENGGRMAILSAEGDTFDLMTGRYSQQANLGVYLKSHNAETVIVDRVGRKGERVERCALTLGLAIQPEVIRGLMAKQQLRGRGMLGRILYSLPQDRLGYREVNPPPVSPKVAETYQEIITALLRLPASKNEFFEDAPHPLMVAPNAHALLLEYQQEVENDLRPGAELGDVTDWGGKLCGAVVRISALLHMADLAECQRLYRDTAPPPVTEGAMERAILIGRYFTAHALAAFAEMGADELMDDARYILAWIERQGVDSFKVADIYHSLRRRFRDTKREDRMTAALDFLARRSYLRFTPPTEAERQKNGKGLYHVNPAVFSAQTGQSNTPSAWDVRDVWDIYRNPKSQSEGVYNNNSGASDDSRTSEPVPNVPNVPDSDEPEAF